MTPLITALTLIDITPTNAIRGESLERDQQRNWETVLQMLGLKTQPIIVNGPTCWNNERLDEFEFGKFYEGTHNVWAFQFRGERDDYYDMSLLEEDFDQVSVITGLTETARFMLPLFHTHGHLKNIYFKHFELELI